MNLDIIIEPLGWETHAARPDRPPDTVVLALHPASLPRGRRAEVRLPDSYLRAGEHREIAEFAERMADGWPSLWHSSAVPHEAELSRTVLRYMLSLTLQAGLFYGLAIVRAAADLRPSRLTICRRGPVPDPLLEGKVGEYTLSAVVFDCIISAALRQAADRPGIDIAHAACGPDRERPGRWTRLRHLAARVLWTGLTRPAVIRGNLNKAFPALKRRVGGGNSAPTRPRVAVGGTGRCIRSFVRHASRTHDFIMLPAAWPADISIEPRPARSPAQEACSFKELSLTEPLAMLCSLATAMSRPLAQAFRREAAEAGRLRAGTFICTDPVSPAGNLQYRAFVEAGVRTVRLVDGLSQPMDDSWSIEESGYLARLPGEVWAVSDRCRDAFVAGGAVAGRIEVPGYLEPGSTARRPGQGRWRRALGRLLLGTPGAGKTILLALGTVVPERLRLVQEETPFEILSGMQDVLDAAGDIDGAVVVLRPHPGTDGASLRLMARAAGESSGRFARHLPIALALAAADVVVTYQSSVGLQALLAGRHLVVYNHTRRDNFLCRIARSLNGDPAAGVAARVTHDTDGLRGVLREMLSAPLPRAPVQGLGPFLANAAPGYDQRAAIERLGFPRQYRTA